MLSNCKLWVRCNQRTIHRIICGGSEILLIWNWLNWEFLSAYPSGGSVKYEHDIWGSSIHLVPWHSLKERYWSYVSKNVWIWGLTTYNEVTISSLDALPSYLLYIREKNVSTLFKSLSFLGFPSYWYVGKEHSRRNNKSKGSQGYGISLSLRRIEVAGVTGTDWSSGRVWDEIEVILEAILCQFWRAFGNTLEILGIIEEFGSEGWHYLCLKDLQLLTIRRKGRCRTPGKKLWNNPDCGLNQHISVEGVRSGQIFGILWRVNKTSWQTG